MDSADVTFDSRVNCTASRTEDDYFLSYEDLTIHEIMLKDKSRTTAYEQFITENKSLFQDKLVMDVGAGTGILSLFAARAGAKKVYAVEASGVTTLCQSIVAQNRLDDKIVVLHGKVEDIDIPEDVKVDVLLSEWMGFYLLHESMLASVLIARDRFLKTDGIMVPSAASLFLCPVSTPIFYEENVEFWRKIHGFDFSPVIPHVKKKFQSEPQIIPLTEKQCLAEPELVANVDLKYVEQKDIAKIGSHFVFKITKYEVLHGFACWFDVQFIDNGKSLSTAPSADQTHWKQTVIMLPDPLLVSQDEVIKCDLHLQQSTSNPRRYDICIELPDIDETDDEETESEEKINTDFIEASDMLISAVKGKHF